MVVWADNGLRAMSSTFAKPGWGLATFVNTKEHGRQGPWVRPLHEVIDYALVQQRLKHTAKDVETYPEANIMSDNYPMKLTS